MSSIHNRATRMFAVAGALTAVIGCQPVQPTVSEKLNDRPLIIDEAMQQRNWEPTVARYQSGATVAGPTGFLFEPLDTMPQWQQGLVETPLFVGQVILLPVTLIAQPVWTPVTYRGIRTEASYTAAPPLETDEEFMARSPGYR
jgi:hypothetical protein